jgi:serine/threonine protein kinase
MGDTFFYNQDSNASPEVKDLEHLAMIERAVGTIPRVLAEQCVHGEKGKYFFLEKGTLRYPTSSTSEKSRRAYWEPMKLEGYFCSDVNPSLREDGKETRDLLDLARRMLHWLPEKRCTFVEALKHPFFLDD